MVDHYQSYDGTVMPDWIPLSAKPMGREWKSTSGGVIQLSPRFSSSSEQERDEPQVRLTRSTSFLRLRSPRRRRRRRRADSSSPAFSRRLTRVLSQRRIPKNRSRHKRCATMPQPRLRGVVRSVPQRVSVTPRTPPASRAVPKLQLHDLRGGGNSLPPTKTIIMDKRKPMVPPLKKWRTTSDGIVRLSPKKHTGRSQLQRTRSLSFVRFTLVRERSVSLNSETLRNRGGRRARTLMALALSPRRQKGSRH